MTDLLTATIDHIIPKAHFGPGTYENSALLHEKCNFEKADQCPGCERCIGGGEG
jgi:5-methylcytosine-specific restriction endonuclease McrA